MKYSRLFFLIVLFGVFCILEAGRANNPINKVKLKIKKEFSKSTTITQKGLSIVGGTAASNGEFPSVVYIKAISYTNSEEWHCTGALIYLNYVITSAWCIVDGEEFTVLIGENDLAATTPATRSKSRVAILARQWTFHEGFKTNSLYPNNIGLLQLPLSVAVSVNVTVIPMNSFSVSTFYTGVTAKVPGWGVIDPVNNVYPSNLITTNLKIISSAECQKSWAAVNSSWICAASPTTSIGQGICVEDDGAPLIYLGTLLGIGSEYGANCDAKIPSIFTPIAPYITWITQKTIDALFGKFWTVPTV